MFKHHLTRRSLASAVVIAAVGFPSAGQATVMAGGGGGSEPIASGPSVQQPPNQLQSNLGQRSAAEGGRHLSGSAAPARTTPAGGGLQWADAGIGAAGAVVLLTAGALGAGLARRRGRVTVS